MSSAIDPALAIERAALTHQNTMNSLIERGDSAIQQFYSNATVFITGGSGFMGKQLIEKLFRSCNIKKMYLLLRQKKGRTGQQRLETVLKDPVFDSLRATQPSFAKRLIPIDGDIADIGLGISQLDRKTITEEVDIVFHLAATVNFGESLRLSTLINVRGTKEVVILAKECETLRSFVHVSTAFSHATRSNKDKLISEEFYPCNINPEDLIGLIEATDEERLKEMTTELIKNWPNTYTFTKAIAEEVIRTTANDLPVCVVRPPIGHSGLCDMPLSKLPCAVGIVVAGAKYLNISIVTSSYYEPMPGWLDMSCVFGSSGIMIGTIVGLLHVVYLKDVKWKMPLIPVDTMNNAIIAIAWETAKNDEDNHIKVYTLANEEKRLQCSLIHDILLEESTNIASSKSVWLCYVIPAKNKWIFWVLSWLLHYIPAYFLDGVCAVMRRRPKGIKSFAKLYTKVDKMAMMFSYFWNNEFRFNDNNVKSLIRQMSPADRHIFNCDTSTIDFREYVNVWYIGIRKYILKDGLKNSADGVRRQKIFRIINGVCGLVYLYVIWKILSIFWMIVILAF